MGAAAASGVVAGLWTPRGPATTVQALVAMAMGAAVGLIAGAAMRSRWAMVVAPVTFAAAVELIRLDATGPTVDGITLTSDYGVLAFVVGRLFHGILALLPMLVGAALGRAWILRRTSGGARRPHGLRRTAGRVGIAASSTLLLLLTVALVRPASTEPIRGTDGKPLPNSIAELTTVDIGDRDQSLLIRGQDVGDPVVLLLAGGPGGSETGTMGGRAHPLERDFVVVTWDQAGTGRSAGQIDPSDELSFEGAVQDTIEVTEHLRERFGVDQVYLVGNSYGTLLGATAAQRRPDLFAALVGTGQMVDVVETDQIFYEDALAHAEATGDAALVETLRDNGPPPYEDLLDMAPLVASEHEWNDYSDIEGFPGLQEPTDHLFATEYSLVDAVRSMGALVDTYSALYPDLDTIDLRSDVPRLDVPVYLVEGAHEARGRVEPARGWFDALDAPSKDWITLPRSGHRPWVQEPEDFAQVMTGTVLSRVEPGAPIDGAPAAAADESHQLRRLFETYNPDVWPLPLLTYGLVIAALALVVRRPGRGTDRLVAGLMTATWAWTGVVFLGRHAAQVDPLLGAVYGALFVVQAALLARAGIVRHELRFRASSGLAGRVGWAALGYALVAYPLVGIALGHGYPAAPLFGVAPCPTVIATFGLLLLASPPTSLRLLAIPTIWAVLAPLAAVGHGYPEDLGLVVAALAAWVVVTRGHRTGHGRRVREATRR